MVGIFRQIQLLTKKGIHLAQISHALQNYAADPWVKGQPEERRHHIRTFMTADKITRWEKAGLQLEPSLAALTRLAENAGIQEKPIDPLAEEAPCPS